jgi:hypothetical protein
VSNNLKNLGMKIYDYLGLSRRLSIGFTCNYDTFLKLTSTKRHIKNSNFYEFDIWRDNFTVTVFVWGEEQGYIQGSFNYSESTNLLALDLKVYPSISSILPFIYGVLVLVFSIVLTILLPSAMPFMAFVLTSIIVLYAMAFILISSIKSRDKMGTFLTSYLEEIGAKSAQ